MADEDDTAAGLRHRPQRPEQLLDLLGSEDRGRLVHDQDPGAAVEHLEDLDPLLLADAQLPDLRPRIDPQTKFRGKPGDLRLRPSRVEEEPRPIQAEQDVLGDGLRGDEREMLVDHPDAGGDGVPRREERDGLPVDPDLTLVRPVEPGEDVHQRALPGTVLAEQGVDLPGQQLEGDVVVCHDARECLDDPAGVDGGSRGCLWSGRHRASAGALSGPWANARGPDLCLCEVTA